MAKKDKQKAIRAKAREAAKRQAKRSKRGGSSTVKAADGIGFFKPIEEGSQTLSIVNFTVGKNRALLSNIDPGDPYYKASFKRHRDVGPEDKMVVCPSTFGKRCPVCEEYTVQKSSSDAEYDDFKGLRPSERDVFLVIHKDKLYLMEMPFYWFGKLLDNELQEDDDEDGLFFLPGDNIDVRVTWETDSFGTKAVAIRFKKRKTELDEDLIAQAQEIDLGDCVIESSYANIECMFHGADSEDDEDPDDDDDEEKEEPKKKKKGKKKPDPEEEEDDEDDEEPEVDEDEADEDDEPEENDEDEEEEPVKKKGKKGKCLNGFKFGKDNDEHDECDDCGSFKACAKAAG